MEIIENKEYDIAAVLLDLVMPEMDGFEVLKRMNDTDSIVKCPLSNRHPIKFAASTMVAIFPLPPVRLFHTQA